MASVALAQVRKIYPGNVEAVRGVDLEAADGALVVLVGPSGCGKSTLLRMVAGLERVSAGDIRIGQRRVNDVEPADRDVAMVFQNYALYPHMSVRENMSFGLVNRGIGRAEIDRRVRRAGEVLRIADLLERAPRQLSGGQRQRVAMGRALVREPQAFLFDEPLSNLDAQLRVDMRIEIKQLQRDLGVTSLYVTHDQQEALTLADRLIVMNDGKVEQAGAPLEAYDRPATLFVARFIGAPPMNLLPIEVGPGGYRLRASGRPLGGSPACPAGETRDGLILGVRPEHLVAGLPVARHDVAFEFAVETVEPLGAETVLHGRVDGVRVAVKLPGRAGASPGATMPVTAGLDDLHFFDAGDGRRVG